MKKGIAAVLVFAASVLAAATAHAEGPGCGTCCGGPLLRAEVTQQTTTTTKVVPGYKAVSKTVEQEVPCTRTVPVCVTDPCTGCTRTEYKCETVLEKVKTTHIEIVPTCVEKKEDHTRRCVHIYLDHAPACCPAP